MDWLINIGFTIGIFIVTIVILVAFHEFGHFWVARKLGVKVLRFSIGFGKPLWRRQGRDGVEYVIAAIPLGGYVKLLDSREIDVRAEDMHCEFNSQPLKNRVAIVFAGPLFNFILAAILYICMFVIGVSGIRPIVGNIVPNSIAAAAGIERGDEILRVDHHRVRSWTDVVLSLLDHDPEKPTVSMRLRTPDQSERTVLLHTGTVNLLKQNASIEDYGFSSPEARLVIHEILPDGTAAQSMLAVGDKVLDIDGVAINSWQDFITNVNQTLPGQEVILTVERQGIQQEIPITMGEAVVKGKTVSRMGVRVQVDPQAQIHIHYPPLQAFVMGLEKTKDMTVLTLKVLYRLLSGDASPQNLGGPIAIAQFASITFLAGISAYLGMLALLSIGLGILNLLPIPVLDGGHLLYYFVEFIKGSPVSESVQIWGNQLGLAVIAGLTVFVFYNDIARLIQ